MGELICVERVKVAKLNQGRAQVNVELVEVQDFKPYGKVHS